MKQPTIAGLRRIPIKGDRPGAVRLPGVPGVTLLPPSDARAIIDVLKTARTMKQVEAALEYANIVLEGHGVESVWDSSGDRLVGLYINMGDQYEATLIADIPAERFYLEDLETWMLKRQKRYDIP